MSKKIWGLDISSSGIKVLELARTWQGYRVTDFKFHPFFEGSREEKVGKLRQIFQQKRGGKNFILPVPSHQTMTHWASLPFQDRKKNLRVIKFEVEPLLPLPADQVVVDFYDPGEEPDRGALIFAVSKDHLRDQLSLMEDAGLDPECIIPEGIALFEVVKNLKINTSNGAAALMDVGDEKTTLIIWQGENLALVRSIPITVAPGSQIHHAQGIPSLFNGQKEKSEMDEEGKEAIDPGFQRLVEEVLRTLFSYESGAAGRAVEKIFITGDSAAAPGLMNYFANTLERPSEILNLEEYSPSLLKNISEEFHLSLTVALGAAFGGFTGEGERINFRQEEFASSKKARKLKKRTMLIISYGIILSFLGIAVFSTNLLLKERKYRELKAEIRKEFLLAQPGIKKIVSEIQQMKSLVEEERTRFNALGGISAGRSILETIRELSMMIEPNWKIRVTDMMVDPETVEVNGEADSFDTINRLKAKLDRSPFFGEVQLKTAQASSLENVVEFKIQMRRGG